MNKFTRSQMGKIMAYALSAAMAVTVVPTYMMKPLVAEAATTEASKEFNADTNGTANETTLTINSGITAAVQAVEFYVTTTEKDTYNISANGSTDKVDGATVNGSTATVSETNLEAKATNDGTYYVYANYVKDGAVSEDASNLVKVATIVVSDSGNEKNITPEAGFTKDDSTNDYKYTVEAPSPSINFYVSTNASATDEAVSTLTDVTPVAGTVDSTSATVSIDDLKAKAPYTSEPTTYTVYYAYNKTGAVEGTDTLVKAGTITVPASTTPGGSEEQPGPSGSQFGITAASVKQGSVLYDATSNVTSTSKVCLYSKVGDKKAAYVLDAVDYNGDRAYEIVVPYSIPAGKYYMSSNEEETDGISANAQVLEVKAATPITGVTLNATNTDIYYFGAAESYASNEETITVDLKGDTDKTYLDVELVPDTATNQYFEVDQDEDDKTKITVSMKSDLTAEQVASAKGKVKVKVYVAGRNSAYEKTINFKAVEGTSLENKTVSLVAEDSIAMVKSNVTVKTVKPETQEKLTYTIAASTSSNINPDNRTDSGTDGILTLKDDNKKTVATFNIATGEFNAVVADTYTITAAGSINDDANDSESIQYINPTITTVAGVVGATTGNTITVNGLPDDTYAEYTVEDTSIATVAGSSTNALASRVTFVAPGITKVNAHITSYTSGKTYNFETSGYIVTAPKDTEDFDITEVPNTEAYANELQKKSMLDNPLALQLAKGIVDGKVNASILRADTYEAAEDELKDEYSNYYDINATDDNVSATGLLFATYDSKVTDVEDPEDRVAVALTISDLQAKDQQYKIEDSVLDFVAEATVDGEVVELNQPVWLTVTDASKIVNGEKYTVYDDGEEIFTAEAVGNTLTFQTDSFSVFSIVKADADAEVTKNEADIDKPDTPDDSEDIYDLINVTGHVQDIGDMESTVSDDGIISIGTHGNSKRLEKITIEGLDKKDIVMTGHVQDTGDVEQEVDKETGAISVGTEHQSKRLEAFSLALKGDLAEKYDVYYRVHVQDYGWLDWAKNGEVAGTSGHSFRLEAVEIMFVEKGTEIDKEALKKTYEEGNRGKDDKAAYMDRVVASK